MNVYIRPYRDVLSCANIPGEMIPGQVDPVYFRLLVSVSVQRSQALVDALEGVLVRGLPRKEVCGRYGVSPGNLSVKLARLQVVSQTIARMYPCQYDRTDCPVSRHLLIQDSGNENERKHIPDNK